MIAMAVLQFCFALKPISAPKGRGSPSPGQRPRSCTQVGSLSVSMSCKIAQTGLAVTAPSPSRPSSARNGYLLKRPFKSRPRCVHQRGQRPGEAHRDTNVIGPTGQEFSLQSQPPVTQIVYQRKRLARGVNRCSALAYSDPGRGPGLGEPRASGPATYRVLRKKTCVLPTHSDPRLRSVFRVGYNGLVFGTSDGLDPANFFGEQAHG